ncbi:unnamed protein product [Calicophoron daubneyi]|uniref:Sugar phosphate exchanger 3 n=1 Tax=Calicophoron daubneyi TaxID=300641 RepID=A0AAV2T0L4_CALDB
MLSRPCSERKGEETFLKESGPKIRPWALAHISKGTTISLMNERNPHIRTFARDQYTRHAVYVLLLTFTCYTFFHASRKPISVVKEVIHPVYRNGVSYAGWPPFDGSNWSQLIGGLEYSYLFVYAIAMMFSGYLAERSDLRYFLAFGMVLSGLSNIAFGLAYYLDIHQYSYLIGVQIFSGVVQASGWPAVVTLVGNWWGKTRRGLLMGVWNAHTSCGNILGSLVAGYYVQSDWGASFCVPGLILIIGALLVYLTLVDRPERLFSSSQNSPSAHDSDLEIRSSESEPCLVNAVPAAEADTSPKHSINKTERPITFWEAILLPNVFAYAVLLFFVKLVSYTFLYWLPNYLALADAANVNAERAAQLSVVFDLGGICGGILAGSMSDAKGGESDTETIRRRAVTCVWMLGFAAPLLLFYLKLGSVTSFASLGLLFCCGAVVNGPYALITTAVSADLGTQRALQGRARALATITAIIDATGSLGAALGPFLTGLLVPLGWSAVFVMLISSDLLALCISVWIVCKSSQQSRFSPIIPKVIVRV